MDLGGGRVPRRHAELLGSEDVAELVSHRLGVDEKLVLDDLEVGAGEPHAPRPLRGHGLHAQPSGAPDAQVHRHLGDGAAVGSVPGREVLGHSPERPDRLRGCRKRALDHHAVAGVVLAQGASHVLVVGVLRVAFVELCEVAAHPVEAGLPHRSVLLGPGRHLLERCCIETARPELRLSATHDQAGLLENLEVLGDGWQGQLEGFSELVDGRLALGKPREHRAPGGVRECREGGVEPLIRGGSHRAPYFTYEINNYLVKYASALRSSSPHASPSCRCRAAGSCRVQRRRRP